MLFKIPVNASMVINMAETYNIRKLKTSEIEEALNLVWKVFEEFEAPDYSDEGVQEFKNFIVPENYIDKILKSELIMWGCFIDTKIVGIITIRPPCHIALLFVDKTFHRKGIARSLFNTVLDHYKKTSEYTEMTVNSSPYALEVYRRLGFVDTDTEQLKNGIRFVPMKYTWV